MPPDFWYFGTHFQHDEYTSKVCTSIFWFLHLHIWLLVLKARHYRGKVNVICGAGSRDFPKMFAMIPFLTDIIAKKEPLFFLFFFSLENKDCQQ